MNEDTGQCISECEPVTGFQRSAGSGELLGCWQLGLEGIPLAGAWTQLHVLQGRFI